jgi:serine/threonine protein kinase/Tfp pilus assembly protein PilF
MTLAIGTRLGPYEIVAPIGAGGMGEVYRARDSRLERDVAVKVLPESLVRDADALARFEREAKAVASLSHPNILAIHDFGRHAGILYAVMELLEGETLRDRLAASGLSQRKAVDYALQIVQGLAAAHERGIVHRDLKPQNIFVTRDGLVKILDFGLAKTSERSLDATGRGQAAAAQHPTAGNSVTASPPLRSPGLTEPGVVLGTARYMSPEQVRGGAVDPRSDLFSFGSILYEMLAGEPAFRRDTDVETMMAILKEEPQPLSTAGRTIAPELADLVAHCLEKKPAERFQTARDLAFALKVIEKEGRAGSGPSSASASAAAAAAASAEASIAVLPFRNLSADREAEYFSDGMTEEIITALSKIESLHVASRTSAFAFKGRDEDVRKIGAALGVRTVLEGSVRQAGGEIRVTAQLINVADGYNLWSERYDREMKNVFALQDEISRAIAETLKVRLLPAEETRLAARGTENVEAYNDYLKGRYFFNRREAAEAIVEFERALSRDPNYTAAYTGLADSYCIFGFYGGIETREAFARAREAAQKAFELEPDSADVQVSLGLVEHYFGWDLGRQEKYLRRAIELSPRSAVGYTWLSLRLCFDPSRHAESLELARKAVELEPLSANVQTNVGWAYLGNHQFEEASREFRQALHIDPLAPYPLWALGVAYRLMGRHAEAVTTLEKALEITMNRQSFYVGMLGAAYAAAGRRRQALGLLDELRERSRREYVSPHHVAFVCIPLGDFDLAFEYLMRACDERNCLMWWLGGSPIFDPLRSDPRFPKLLEKVVSE